MPDRKGEGPSPLALAPKSRRTEVPTPNLPAMMLESAQRFTEDLVKSVRSLVRQDGEASSPPTVPSGSTSSIAAWEDTENEAFDTTGASGPAVTGDDGESAAERAAAAVVEEEPPALPSASWTLSGDGLQSAVVGQLSSFVIESFDATGARRQQGGDKFKVSLTGAAEVRTRVFDEGDGRYTCEFRCPSSGKYWLAVKAHSTHLPGSPFLLDVKALSLKEYKEHRAKEVVVLKEKRKQKERERGARRDEKERPPSPRINAAEQLAKAYELALQIARGGAKSRPQDQLECAPD